MVWCTYMMKWLLLFSLSVVSNSLQPHGLQHIRLPCPSPSPIACSNSCPLSRWCHPTISSSVVPLFLPSIFPSIRVFSNESFLFNSSRQVAKVLELQLQHPSCQRIYMEAQLYQSFKRTNCRALSLYQRIGWCRKNTQLVTEVFCVHIMSRKKIVFL